MRMLNALTLAVILLASSANAGAQTSSAVSSPVVAVAPQYDNTQVYVAVEDLDRFVTSFLATFGGSTSKQGVATVTPTPSSTVLQMVFTPVGTLSVFGFTTPVPYPFGSERTGYLVTDLGAAVRTARASGADVIVAPFNDPIGRDAIVQWPGGVSRQVYWHTTAPSYAKLQTIPENRVYVSPDRADAFIRSFVAFSGGTVASEDPKAPGVEIGRPGDTYRRVRLASTFGNVAVLVTDGHLPYPYGRELTGYETLDLDTTLAKEESGCERVLVAPYSAADHPYAFVQFPGGYVAEIHATVRK